MLRPKTPAKSHSLELNRQIRCLCELNGDGIESDSRLTVQLKNDHRAITCDLGRLRASGEESEVEGRSGEAMLLTHVIGSLTEHFQREEQFLFPMLSRSLGSGICDRLNDEHAEILRVAKELSAQTRPLEEQLTYLKQLFRAHISTEENVLFWYLDLQPTE